MTHVVFWKDVAENRGLVALRSPVVFLRKLGVLAVAIPYLPVFVVVPTWCFWLAISYLPIVVFVQTVVFWFSRFRTNCRAERVGIMRDDGVDTPLTVYSMRLASS